MTEDSTCLGNNVALGGNVTFNHCLLSCIWKVVAFGINSECVSSRKRTHTKCKKSGYTHIEQHGYFPVYLTATGNFFFIYYHFFLQLTARAFTISFFLIMLIMLRNPDSPHIIMCFQVWDVVLSCPIGIPRNLDLYARVRLVMRLKIVKFEIVFLQNERCVAYFDRK